MAKAQGYKDGQLEFSSAQVAVSSSINDSSQHAENAKIIDERGVERHRKTIAGAVEQTPAMAMWPVRKRKANHDCAKPKGDMAHS